MKLPPPTLLQPSEGIKTGKRGGPIKDRAPVLTPIAYDLAYGKDSAAQPGMVMFRISVDGAIMRELNMPPEEFLQLAHAMEVVARAVAADL